MGILLTILKIIGITLLVILLLILLILLLVLLVPIRYSASGGKEESDFEVTARVTWLLHLISVQVGYRNRGEDKELTKDVRVLGISLLKKKGARDGPEVTAPQPAAGTLEDADKEPVPPELSAAAAEQTASADFFVEPVDGIPADEAAGSIPTEESGQGTAASSPETGEESAGNDIQPVEESSADGETAEEETGGSPRGFGAVRFYSFLYNRLWPVFSWCLDKAFKLMHKAIAFVADIWRIPWRFMTAIGHTWLKLDKLRVTAQRWLIFLNTESTRQVLGLAMDRIKRMLKHILPRQLEGRVEFGSEDPSQTGMIYGAYAAMYPKVGDRFSFTPSFEEKKLNGEVSLKGKIVLGYLLLQVLAIIANRNTITVIRGFLKLKGGKA